MQKGWFFKSVGDLTFKPDLKVKFLNDPIATRNDRNWQPLRHATNSKTIQRKTDCKTQVNSCILHTVEKNLKIFIFCFTLKYLQLFASSWQPTLNNFNDRSMQRRSNLEQQSKDKMMQEKVEIKLRQMGKCSNKSKINACISTRPSIQTMHNKALCSLSTKVCEQECLLKCLYE